MPSPTFLDDLVLNFAVPLAAIFGIGLGLWALYRLVSALRLGRYIRSRNDAWRELSAEHRRESERQNWGTKP